MKKQQGLLSCCLGKGAGKKTFGKSLLLGFLLLTFLFSEPLRYAQGTRLYGMTADKQDSRCIALLGFLLLAYLFSELLRYAQGTRLYGMTADKQDSQCIALLGFLLLTFLFSKRKVREFCARTVAFPAHICYYCRIKTKF